MFENGLELLHALSTSLFDLILLDIVMPVLDGCTTCLFIRGRSPMHSIPDFIVGEHRSYSLPIVPTITSSPQSDMESPLSAPPPYRPRALSSPTLTIPIETPPTILEFNSSVPIVAITSNARPHEVALYLSLGMNDVVEKPVRCGEKFAGIIRSLLANRLGSVDTVT
ncbi:uncharacterized protein SPPG_02860 [Spizellomyces punctatus DAOM BR117]|uniref:Response regulatory domain-containing protein n=1 Tax=Spizellomyces punctatus (strain DAOM BR117) TaxID=645134 RepID=A0A0L0HLT3_SPIPD|nr:uncharacterized protein SPPG_02860 [Spizellomyces punctatus DAOM BR117]KND02391.1 hypothetical protein SPPG_02860 [Spizellomyces punctatus DAOM BR117]|eukprot:XP_016610430.1 hypothetical protein SPPG_02860 [Spizellomyces punctatus DAOM BR117]